MSSNESLLGASPTLTDTPCALVPSAPWVEPMGRTGMLDPTPASPPPELPEVELPVSALRDALNQGFSAARDAWIESFERTYVRQLLERHGRNVAAAAVAAGVDRTYIYRLMRRHGI